MDVSELLSAKRNSIGPRPYRKSSNLAVIDELNTPLTKKAMSRNPSIMIG